MKLVRVRRDVSAPPSSVALLLAGPSAAELWRSDDLSLDVGPPVRSSTGYAAALRVSRDGIDVGHGTVSIATGSISIDLRADDDAERDLCKALPRYLRRLDDEVDSATSAA